MEIVQYREDVWGREVLQGVSWDLLWLVIAATFILIMVHAAIMLARKSGPRPSPDGERVSRHAALDRWFHWITAATFLVLLATGVLPIVGVKFPWLTAHWVAGIVLTAAIVFHIIRSLFWKDLAAVWIKPSDLAELTGGSAAPLPGKYSLAQKGMHLVMAVLVLIAVGSGIALLAQIDTPWWERSNLLSESALGWMFLLHGLSTLALIGFAALHLYFTARPEKQFYLRSMIKGWVSRSELTAHHDPARWTPDAEASEDAATEALPGLGADAR